MPIVVEVVSEADYKIWLDKKKGAATTAAADDSKTFDQAELIARGEKVYAANCAACHQADAWGFPACFSNQWVESGNRPIDAHISTVLNAAPAPRWQRSAGSCPTRTLPPS